ncbi:MAG: adenosylmethionine--8-amino-7-oxononanoate transaminase [Deltaproteobacteria bacterium HGW-Deltaproteobacteria-2]|jgi:adenosylmethionine-8-amino-7-oxononanoate aminotransferase|nr:MAG: adenosylmethionine--8-amino-7-oxononanoate transaminase [Deltaproteobacteria bacterium HGW-Deltaproteobacteria-2]
MTDLLQKDLTYNWHPYTQMSIQQVNPPLLIEKARGIKLYDASGQWYYDTISSWWCNIHGHLHPRIVNAIKQQLNTLDHTLFAGITHKTAIDLSERLVQLTPEGLQRVFYSDNGSTAVEVALKMSLQYWRNSGRPEKSKFVSFDRAYHGDTAGCMSVSGESVFTSAFTPLMFTGYKVPSPYCYRCPMGQKKDECATECVSLLEDVLREHADVIAAVILEPLILCAGGMLIYPAAYLAEAARLSRQYNVHLILDEVAVGFGRTGTMFACEQADVCPDFLCLSKGLTSGMLPLAATLTTQDVFNAFLGPLGSDKTFYHGHTYTANPIGCSAALASLDIFAEEGTLSHVQEISQELRKGIEMFKEHPMVGDIRTIGTVAAFELVKNKKTKEPLAGNDEKIRNIYSKGLENNVMLRPIGNVIYLFLPLSTTLEELKDIISKTHASMIE